MDIRKNEIPLDDLTMDNILGAFLPDSLQGEKTLFATKGKVDHGIFRQIPAFVTTHRVLFYEEKKSPAGVSYRADELPLSAVTECELGEEGFLVKKPFLLLNGKKIYGDREDLQGMREAVRKGMDARRG